MFSRPDENRKKQSLFSTPDYLHIYRSDEHFARIGGWVASASAASQPWVESVILHPDVLSPNLSEDIFVLDLGLLADGNKNVPAVYRDPEQFFRASYLTTGLKSLLEDVLSRLAGGAGNRVLKLITPYGGRITPSSMLVKAGAPGPCIFVRLSHLALAWRKSWQ